MRVAYNNQKFILDEQGEFIGVSLGYDFCAEHEWGIKNIKSQFGVGEENNKDLSILTSNPIFGLKLRMISKGSVSLFQDGKYTFLCSGNHSNVKDKIVIDTLLPFQMSKKSFFNSNLQTAWDSRDFCLYTNDKEGRNYLEKLKSAFDNFDIAIANLSGGPFEGTSLSLLIAHKIPQEYKNQMYDADKSEYELAQYEKQIGITALKEKFKKEARYQGEKYFMVCSPKWIDYFDHEKREERKKEMNTKHDIMFWINYSDNDNNYGWYTVEEILQWFNTPGLKLTQIRKA